jgi:hypothetical protein
MRGCLVPARLRQAAVSVFLLASATAWGEAPADDVTALRAQLEVMKLRLGIVESRPMRPTLDRGASSQDPGLKLVRQYLRELGCATGESEASYANEAEGGAVGFATAAELRGERPVGEAMLGAPGEEECRHVAMFDAGIGERAAWLYANLARATDDPVCAGIIADATFIEAVMRPAMEPVDLRVTTGELELPD